MEYQDLLNLIRESVANDGAETLKEKLRDESPERIYELAKTGYFMGWVERWWYQFKTKVIFGFRGYDARTVLHAAASYGHTEVIKCVMHSLKDEHRYALLEVPSLQSNSTALHYAADAGNPKACEIMLKLIVEESARVELIKLNDGSGRNALHLAAYKGHKDVIESVLNCIGRSNWESLLIEKTRKERRHTILHCAAKNNHPELVEVVMKIVVNPASRHRLLNARDHQNMTPKEKAVKYKSQLTIDELSKAHEDVDADTVSLVEADEVAQLNRKVDELTQQLAEVTSKLNDEQSVKGQLQQEINLLKKRMNKIDPREEVNENEENLESEEDILGRMPEGAEGISPDAVRIHQSVSISHDQSHPPTANQSNTASDRLLIGAAQDILPSSHTEINGDLFSPMRRGSFRRSMRNREEINMSELRQRNTRPGEDEDRQSETDFLTSK